jgi:hypothetical protein
MEGTVTVGDDVLELLLIMHKKNKYLTVRYLKFNKDHNNFKQLQCRPKRDLYISGNITL